MKEELLNLGNTLEKQPETGTPLENNTYKIRLAIESKGKGKSGGARVVTYLVTESYEVYLLTIYDKSDFENFDDNILKSIINSLRPS